MTAFAPTVSLVLTWLLFLALFPIAFFWYRRVWRILAKRDFSEVALKKGEPPPNAEKYAPYAVAINLIGAVIITWTIVGVVLALFEYDTWTAMAGVTIWTKFFADFALSRTAHPIVAKKKGGSNKVRAGEQSK